MHAEEKAIIDYLKGWPLTFISGREIARKVGGRERYEEDRGWALPILSRMVHAGMLETDHLGYFRLKKEDPRKKRQHKHVSPQILRILKSSGKSFEGIVIDDDAPEAPAHRKPATPTARENDKRA